MKICLNKTKILTIPSSGEILDIDNSIPSTSYATEIVAASASKSTVSEDAPNTVDNASLEIEIFIENSITNFVTKVLNGTTDGKIYIKDMDSMASILLTE